MPFFFLNLLLYSSSLNVWLLGFWDTQTALLKNFLNGIDYGMSTRFLFVVYLMTYTCMCTHACSQRWCVSQVNNNINDKLLINGYEKVIIKTDNYFWCNIFLLLVCKMASMPILKLWTLKKWNIQWKHRFTFPGCVRGTVTTFASLERLPVEPTFSFHSCTQPSGGEITGKDN